MRIDIKTKAPKKRLYYIQYRAILDDAIANFDGIGTIRVFKGKVFIQKESLAFFLELLFNRGVSYSILLEKDLEPLERQVKYSKLTPKQIWNCMFR